MTTTYRNGYVQDAIDNPFNANLAEAYFYMLEGAMNNTLDADEQALWQQALSLGTKMQELLSLMKQQEGLDGTFGQLDCFVSGIHLVHRDEPELDAMLNEAIAYDDATFEIEDQS